jgi:hypothetical protein
LAGGSVNLHVGVAAQTLDPAFLGFAGHLVDEDALDLLADVGERLGAGEFTIFDVEHVNGLGGDDGRGDLALFEFEERLTELGLEVGAGLPAPVATLGANPG